MEFLIFIILLIVIYYIFRKKFKSANNDNQLLEETKGYTKKIIIEHSKIFDQTDMFIDIVYGGFFKDWSTSNDDKMKEAASELNNLNSEFETLKKIKFIGKETKDILPFDNDTFQTIKDINERCRKIYNEHLKRYYNKSFDAEWTPKAYSFK